MAFDAGRRFVGNMLRETLQKHDPEGWLRFEGEYLRERHEAARLAAKAAAEAKTAVEAR
jgi:hypothetical protein